MLLVTAAEMRELDRLTIERYGTAGHVLMERAGRGATRVLLERFPHMRRKGRRALVFCGKGNNGGDGLVIARLLRARGVRTEVVLLGRAADVKGDAERNLRAYRRNRAAVHEATSEAELAALTARLAKPDVVVDAIFGTGLSSPLRGVAAAAVEWINSSGAPVLAVDIPSGLDADTGQPMGGAVRAGATATFGFAKIGHVLHPGAQLCGGLDVIDIGIAPQAIAERPPQCALLEEDEVARLVPVREPETHKGSCGHVLAIAGSFGKTGAAALVTRAASRGGAGLVTVCGPASLYPIYAAGVLEAMSETLPDEGGRISFAPERLRALLAGKTVVVVGPGIGTHAAARETVRWLVANAGMPVVLDADALTCLADDPQVLARASAPTVLTPHPGEMARLAGASTADVQRDRVGTARRFAVERRCTLVLKGARTVIAEPSGRVWINPTGNPGMASGGMGDVLAGFVAALLAQRLAPGDAARLAVYAHGAAADRSAAQAGEIGLVASDVLAGLRRELHLLRGRRGG